MFKRVLAGQSTSSYDDYFQLKRHDIHDYDIRNKNKPVIDRVKLESTKRADIFNNCL